METSRHTSPLILALAVIVGGALLLRQSGFFDGVFRTEILASVKTEDILTAADIAAMRKPMAAQKNVDMAETASVR